MHNGNCFIELFLQVFMVFDFQTTDSNVKDIIECLILGLTGKQYPESVRVFCLTLHFHKPGAYNYLRELFNCNLPHLNTLQKWYYTSTSNGKPGISEDALNVLKNLAETSETMKTNGQELLCSLSLDEMAIRRNVQYSDAQKTFFGRISYGSRSSGDEFDVAKNAIVFMVSGINEKFEIPIAFHFIKELNANERVCLLKEVLAKLTSVNIQVVNVTFDGLSANITMCKHLGASFTKKDFRPYFNYPDATEKIYIILDPSHMLKLVRNALATYKVLYDGNGNKIEWKYFETLEEFRSEKGYALAHKLTKNHIQWYRAPMRVYLAAETLSNSVADAMDFLKSKGKAEFSGCAATTRFIRYFNNIFDASNSDRVTNAKFKSSITPNNQVQIFSYFQDAIEYILSLSVDVNGTRTRLVYSRRRTAFRGLIINMVNMQNIYRDLVDSKKMEALHTFRFSQDLLEALFGRLRMLDGCNDNPNVQQFCGAFRKATVHTEISCSSFSNCIDSLNILSVSSAKSKTVKPASGEEIFGVVEYLEYVNKNRNDQEVDYDEILESLEDCNTAHVAGMIEKSIMNCGSSGRFKCADYYNIFFENEKVDLASYPTKTYAPCKSSYHICAVANKNFKNSISELYFDYSKLLNSTLRSLNWSILYPKTCFENHEHHKFYIVQFIVEEFVRIQAHYLAKNATLKEQEKMMRSKLKKIIHNLGQ